ncbi:glycosyltransferase family 2 protein [Aurantivibrio plasticivorans]
MPNQMRNRQHSRNVLLPHFISVVIPALNEEESIGLVVKDLHQKLLEAGFDSRFEIIVADNNSTDNTAHTAISAGAKVIHEPRRGYGAACWSACEASIGDILVFVDADGAANSEDSIRLINAVAAGSDLVVGIRKNPERGSMSISQKFGNWLVCQLLRLLWRIKTEDLGPHRAIRREAFDAMQMEDRGFGWTVEMQIKAALLKQRVVELPVRWQARVCGESKISGSLTGVVKAGFGILGMITHMHQKYPASKKLPWCPPPITHKRGFNLFHTSFQHPIEERKTL